MRLYAQDLISDGNLAVQCDYKTILNCLDKVSDREGDRRAILALVQS